MQNTKILELLNNGQVEELKAMIQDEIFQDGIKAVHGAKQRYAAMKKYFKYQDNEKESLQKPCKVTFQGEEYNSFIDGYSIVLTKESSGEIAEYDNSNNDYFKVEQLISYSEYDSKMVDVNAILAEAKSKGYKFKKSEVGQNNAFSCAWYFENAYVKIGILDQAFSIINDGEEAEVYYSGKETNIIFIKTSLGICGVLPVRAKAVMENEKIVVGMGTERVA